MNCWNLVYSKVTIAHIFKESCDFQTIFLTHTMGSSVYTCESVIVTIACMFWNSTINCEFIFIYVEASQKLTCRLFMVNANFYEKYICTIALY